MANLNVSSIVRITNDNDNYVYNGIPDWIYEEEILATGTAIWWSPEGAMLAFAQFDDTQVELQEYPWYGATTIDNSSQYLDRVRIKYPKVSIGLINQVACNLTAVIRLKLVPSCRKKRERMARECN